MCLSGDAHIFENRNYGGFKMYVHINITILTCVGIAIIIIMHT